MVRKPAGCFITFEGGDGTGKSTQVARLATSLRAVLPSCCEVVVTREPGGAPFAEEIRALLLQPGARNRTPRAEALLFAAARADHVAVTISPALARGAFVLCDRYVDSTRVYQGLSGALSPADLTAVEQFGTQGLLPDLTLILDLDSETSRSRALERARLRAPDQQVDTFEAWPAERHAAIASAFRALAAEHPERCKLVNARGTPADVAAEIWTHVAPLATRAIPGP